MEGWSGRDVFMGTLATAIGLGSLAFAIACIVAAVYYLRQGQQRRRGNWKGAPDAYWSAVGCFVGFLIGILILASSIWLFEAQVTRPACYEWETYDSEWSGEPEQRCVAWEADNG